MVKRFVFKKKNVRKVAKRRTFLGRTLAVARPTVGLGTSTTTVLRTSFFYNATAAAGTGVFTGYLRPGSCFDPTGDLSTIQPQMFDQFAAQYNRYLVNDAIVKITVTGAVSSTGSYAWVMAAYPAVDSTALATYQAAASQQFAKTISGGFQLLGGATSYGAGTEPKHMTFHLKQPAIVGYRGDAVDSGALVTSDPPALQHMVLPLFLQSNAAGASTWVLEIDIWQNVTFSQKKNVTDA